VIAIIIIIIAIIPTMIEPVARDLAVRRSSPGRPPRLRLDRR
jgi:hypothetical protein